MTNLELTFDFENLPVRTITDGETIWFVGMDVAGVLGYRNGSRDVNRHVDEEDRKKIKLSDGKQRKETIIINEAGVYSLIFSSKMPYAKKFKHWVTHDVLPSIRKQGYYSLISDDELVNVIIEKQRLNRDFLNKIDKTAIKSMLLRESREVKEDQTDLLFLRQRELSSKQFLSELKSIWRDDMPMYHKYYDKYYRWYEKIGYRIVPSEED